jgi:hypothetical protein
VVICSLRFAQEWGPVRVPLANGVGLTNVPTVKLKAVRSAGAPFVVGRYFKAMSRSSLNAEYYRNEAKRCREAAAEAKDGASEERWLKAERRWLTLANQAELVSALNRKPR